MFLFYNPRKQQNNRKFSNVFRGYRSGALYEKGLTHSSNTDNEYRLHFLICIVTANVLYYSSFLSDASYQKLP